MVDAAAAQFGVEVSEFIGGRANEHWFVRRGSAEMVLRRFRPIRSLAYARYEADLLERLHALGLPVPRVTDVAEIDGGVWMLMTKVPGEPGTYEDDDQRWRGQQLAMLQESSSQFIDLGQREGRAFSDEVVNSPTLDDALRAYSKLFPVEARILQWHVERTRELFAEHDVATLPECIVHGDFAPWNLHFTAGELTGIVDFDLAHLDFRIADFALSWRGKYDDVIHGFDDISPLTDHEWALLTPIRWGWLFLFMEDSIDEMLTGRIAPHGHDWVVQQLLRRTPLMGVDANPYSG